MLQYLEFKLNIMSSEEYVNNIMHIHVSSKKQNSQHNEICLVIEQVGFTKLNSCNMQFSWYNWQHFLNFSQPVCKTHEINAASKIYEYFCDVYIIYVLGVS